MVKLSFVFQLCFIFLFSILISADLLLDSKYGYVVFSSVIFRHGERTPDNIFPLNPYNESYWVKGLGQLTNNGKLEMYELGQWYRQWYFELLKEGYSSEEMYMRSSDDERTIMSAECVLAGLYPPNESEIWNPTLLWQPVPVHSISEEVDNILARSKPCEKLDYLLQELNNLPEFMEYYREKTPLFNRLARLTGYTFNKNDIAGSLFNATLVLDTLNLQVKYGIPTPSWFTEPLISELEEVAQTLFTSYYTSTELIRLQMGMMLGIITNDMTAKKNGNLPEKKFEFFSGHESKIIGLAITLGTYDESTNFLDASIMIELRKHNDDYNVLVILKHSNISNPTVLEMSECPLPCSLDQFIVAIEEYIPIDWDEECKMTNYSQLLLVVFLVLISIIALCSIFYIIRSCYINSKTEYYEM